MVNRAQMGHKSKASDNNGPLTHKYGKPQGNEFPYGKEILRQLGIFEFDVVGRFKSSKEAHQVYRDWIKENEWNYSKPIVGWDNGPITIDSWGKKIND